jgi:flagellar biosynthesis/type III secretory pathway M-ring protein FliF/YscJ
MSKIYGTPVATPYNPALIKPAVGNVTDISIAIAADGTVTLVSNLDNNESDNIVISTDANKNPNSLTINGSTIPITFTEATT